MYNFKKPLFKVGCAKCAERIISMPTYSSEPAYSGERKTALTMQAAKETTSKKTAGGERLGSQLHWKEQAVGLRTGLNGGKVRKDFGGRVGPCNYPMMFANWLPHRSQTPTSHRAQETGMLFLQWLHFKRKVQEKAFLSCRRFTFQRGRGRIYNC